MAKQNAQQLHLGSIKNRSPVDSLENNSHRMVESSTLGVNLSPSKTAVP